MPNLKENPRATLNGSRGYARGYTGRMNLKAQAILADFRVDGKKQAQATQAVRIRIALRSNGDGFNYLAFHHLAHGYIQHLTGQDLSPTYIKSSKATLFDYAHFLENEGVSIVQETDRQIWRSYTNHLTGRNLSKATVAHYQTVLRQFYRWLRFEEVLDKNPFEGLRSPKRDKRLPHFLTVEEAKRFVEYPDISTTEGQRDRAMLELFYASGIRASELTGLNLNKINLDTRELLVWGKGDKERIVLFGEPASKALATYLREGRPNLFNGIKTPAVFLNRQGERITKSQVNVLVHRYGQEGIGKRVHPHLLRHTFATHLLDGGADLSVIAELLGHASFNSTEIYTHISLTHLRQVYLSAYPLVGNNLGKEN